MSTRRCRHILLVLIFAELIRGALAVVTVFIFFHASQIRCLILVGRLAETQVLFLLGTAVLAASYSVLMVQ